MRMRGLVLAVLLFGVPALPANAESVLRRVIAADLTSVDPHLIGNEYETIVTSDLFEGLTVYGPDATIRPGVAERWDLAPDGRSYVFHLRPGLTWSDGSPLTAADFVYSLRRALDPATGSPYNEILYPIAGARAIAEGTVKDPATLGVTALDPVTLRIALDRPAAFLPAVLAHSMAFPVPEAAIQRWGKDWIRPEHFIGDGAFTLGEWVPQSRLTFRRNPHYHAAASVGLDRIDWLVISDDASAYKAFRTGEVDIADLAVRLLPEARREVSAALHEQHLLNSRYVEINMARPPLATDRRLREALALALDQTAIETKVVKQGGTPAFSFVPDGMPGYIPPRQDFAALPMADRLARARQIWAEAGQGRDHPLTLEFLTDDLPDYVLEAKAIAALWQQALPGLTIKLDTNEYQVVTARLIRHDYQISLSSWNADFPDPWNFLAAWRRDAGTTNVIAYRNAGYEAALDRAQNLLDPAPRMAQLAAAERLLLDDYAILPYGFGSDRALVAAAASGWQANALGIHLSRYMSLTR
ncbi:MAG: peptide transporter substrate-binding protein [Rhodospirillales bacterium]|nr:peptide transporter substrate-binding protein [Rhodospirillales bacterium]